MNRGSRVSSPRKARRAALVSLRVPEESGLRVSAGGFWKLCRSNPDLRLERTARGEVIVMTPAGAESGGRNARLIMRLGIWAEADGTGRFFDSSAGFSLPNGATRAPDASWVLLERWNAIPAAERERFAPICPDFVVELQSPSDSRKALRKKMAEYLAQGARLGWLLDPQTREVEVYRVGRAAETLRQPASLSGENVLPGFVLELQGVLFD